MGCTADETSVNRRLIRLHDATRHMGHAMFVVWQYISQLPKAVNTLPSSEYTDSYTNSVIENAVHLTAN